MLRPRCAWPRIGWRATPLPDTPSQPVQVTFDPAGTRVASLVGSTVLDAGRDAGLILAANCGGNGICGRCRVTMLGSSVPDPTDVERRTLDPADIEAGERLACRARLGGDTRVNVPRVMLANQQRPLLAGDSAGGWLYSDQQRPRRTPSSDAAALGVAVDLGSTKIAAYLLDLATGEQLTSRGITNPQTSYGEDLVSRLTYASKGAEQAEELAQCVQSAVAELIESLVVESGSQLEQVADICVVGNTAMTQLFLQLPIGGLLSAPFTAFTSPVDIPAESVGIRLPRNPYLHVPPAIGAFVGADQVAVMLANGLNHAAHVALEVDIGTNTEVALSKPGEDLLLTASCPAGPALEGGHVRHGMRAAPGAIDKVTSTPDGFSVRTIDRIAPIGLCGSGVIDAIALLWRSGAIDRRGHLLAGARGVRESGRGREFLLVDAAETGNGVDIVVTQGDIGEIQLAKAAIAASIRTLLAESGTAVDEVDEVVLAGAFGSYLDIESSISIGLLPHFPYATYVQVGNSAGTGAKMALVSSTARAEAAQIAGRARRTTLTSHPGFNRELALATRFEERPPC